MKNKKIPLLLVILLIILSLSFFISLNAIMNSRVIQNKMQSCSLKEDCIPVGCRCTCNGCGGFSYEEIINNKYETMWYFSHLCKKPEACDTGCCIPSEIACENGLCIVRNL